MKETIDYVLNQVVDTFAAKYGDQKVELDTEKLLFLTQEAKKRILKELELDKSGIENAEIVATKDDSLRDIYLLHCVHESRFGTDSFVSTHYSKEEAEAYVPEEQEEACFEPELSSKAFDYTIEKKTLDISKMAIAGKSLDEKIKDAKEQSEALCQDDEVSKNISVMYIE